MTQEQETDEQGKKGDGVAAPTISLPKGGGAIRGIGEKFAANPVTGTGSMTMPIPASPGRAGFGPQLSLSYDSGAGNGPFGFGWGLSLPAITRKTDKGLPLYRDAESSDVFILSGAEDLVPVLKPDGTRFKDDSTVPGYTIHRYRPRIEGLFARIERWTSQEKGDIHWRSITKDNILTIYGKDGNSRIAEPGNGRRVFSWLICETRDDKGNAVHYEYKAENSQHVVTTQVHEENRSCKSRATNRYIKHIRYGNRVSLLDPPGSRPRFLSEDALQNADWMFEVVFDYGDHDPENPTPNDTGEWFCRHDPFSSCRSGFEVRTYRLCQRVLMFHHFPNEPGVGRNCLVRSTDLAYRDLRDNPDDATQGHPIASFIASIVQSGYRRANDGYLKKSMPPLEFEYSQAVINEKVQEVDAESLENLPAGLDGATYQWVDLDGEGISGILTEQAGAWYYKRNLGPVPGADEDGEDHVNPRFGPLETVATRPTTSVASGQARLVDLSGDGQLDVAVLAGPIAGFYERTQDEDWEPFRAFRHMPNIDWDEPNLRLVDLNGDGHADVLITEHEVFTWHASLAEEGFGPARRVHKPPDEERGPRLVLADGTQSVYLADMCGDGLSDLVRIRNGEVCYWPSLGYGWFGSKVTMDSPPRFDEPDQFDQRRVRLADIDGSGTNDIIYLGRDGVELFFNQSGNSWSKPHPLSRFPRIDNVSSVMTADLLGNGTACLVWSSPLPDDARRPMCYIDLMGGHKPHLLTKSVNNLGAETRVQYAPSTKFYLADKLAGKPWITRIPFPVHVVERVETRDRISGNRFVTLYAYHHGYFDGEEREFRGFGMVEQWDTERYSEFGSDGLFPVGSNHQDEASHVPPVYTRTWFHTGAYIGRNHISDFFAGLLDGGDIGEYYREPDLTDVEAKQRLLDDTMLLDEFTLDEEREACRALKGSMLRQEVYALDGTGTEGYPHGHPYTVTEQNFAVRRLQAKEGNRRAAFFTHAHESINYHYERNPADPRIAHRLVLEVDEYGNVVNAIDIVYPRRGGGHPDEQRYPLVTCSENTFMHLDDQGPDCYRHSLPLESRTYQITGPPFTRDLQRRLSATELRRDLLGQEISAIDYHEIPDEDLQKRVLTCSRFLYYRDNLDPDDPLPWGEVEPLAIPYDTYRLTFTKGILDLPELDGRIAHDLLIEGGYTNSSKIDGDPTHWWSPSGIQLYRRRGAEDPEPTEEDFDPSAQSFYQPIGMRDPFGHEFSIAYDNGSSDDEDRWLLMKSVTDPYGNVTTARNDYRLLQPWEVTGPNGNGSRVAFDALGMVTSTAAFGRDGEGDTLEDPTARFEYDLFAYSETRDAEQPQPNWARTLTRERHADPASPWQESWTYFDGFGRTVLTKAQAEDGLAPIYDETGRLRLDEAGKPLTGWTDDRWVGNGATVYNNKGLPIRQYEPFFDRGHAYTDEEVLVHLGVSPTLHYDPLGRLIRTDMPDGSFSRVRFDAWQRTTYDRNDTVRDSDWYAARTAPDATDAERTAADKTAKHHDTPGREYLDVLGRPFVTTTHNIKDGEDEFIPTHTDLDIEGNPLVITDGRRCEELSQQEALTYRGNTVMTYAYAMGGLQVRQNSMDAGERRILVNVAGNPIHRWDSRGHHVHTCYDALQRPTHVWVDLPLDNGAVRTILAERMVYGEDLADAEARLHNLRSRLYLHFDGAGLVKNHTFDFKGNLRKTSRHLAAECRETPDWTAISDLELDEMEASDLLEPSDPFISRTTYDALDRPVTLHSPDNSITRPGYNKASLLDTIYVRLRGAAEATEFVRNIDYNAKGQRELICYGNGVETRYAYDVQTFRLLSLRTTRAGGTDTLQDLRYTYDPVGNVTEIRDGAIEPVFFRNERVDTRSTYEYDPLYRLIEATGRESAALTGMPNGYDIPRGNRIPAHDRALRSYTQKYEYDTVGNILKMKHELSSAYSADRWARNYRYADDSNRLLETTPRASAETPEEYRYDLHGNMLTLPHLQPSEGPDVDIMQWDYRDQFRHVNIRGTSEAIYNYDATGQRVRKVWLHDGYRDERIYLGGYEVFRRYRVSNGKLVSELQTLHVMDDTERICMVETPTVQAGQHIEHPESRFRYQLSNHLGSVTVELDHENAEVITYEEYHPYGTTAYRARNETIEASEKRYRYTGKERDEETGLYYHGARYYAPWTGIWISSDKIVLRSRSRPTARGSARQQAAGSTSGPGSERQARNVQGKAAGVIDYAQPTQQESDWPSDRPTDGNSLATAPSAFDVHCYAYCHDNPIVLIDINGMQAIPFLPLVDRAIAGACESKGGNPAEQAFCRAHPYAAWDISENIKPIVSRFLRHVHLPTNEPHTMGMPAGVQDRETERKYEQDASFHNAFRHAFWVALMTREHGPEIAEAAALAHENNRSVDRNERRFEHPHRRRSALFQADTTADVLNNEIGRRIAEQNPNASNWELARAVLHEFARNGLWVGKYEGEVYRDNGEYTEGGAYTISKEHISEEHYRTAMEALERAERAARQERAILEPVNPMLF